MKQKRVQEIFCNMQAFEKDTYYKHEVLDELMVLQNDVIAEVYNDDHAAESKLKLYDVERYLKQLNDDCGNIADAEVDKFVNTSKLICNLIKAEISGNRGERRAFQYLERIKNNNIILKNIELGDEKFRTELDAIVIKKDGITIVEVKNTGKDIFIDPEGNYYRTGEYERFDCNIREKMLDKEILLEQALKDAGIENVAINKVVVFTDPRIEVHNKCVDIET